MKKLLHERLRDISECNSPVTAAMVYTKGANESALFQALADEIERYYIPRPRFEDGEPIKQGDDIGDSSVWFIAAFDDGTYHVNLCNGEVIKKEKDELLKRPSPKVLDADGVEIKEGDTVWCIDTGTKLKVVSIDIKDGTVLCDNDFIYDPDVLTHKEPDSLEKLRDDMHKEWLIGFEIGKEKARDWSDRLSALIEKTDQ